jgi:hypothetical protein
MMACEKTLHDEISSLLLEDLEEALRERISEVEEVEVADCGQENQPRSQRKGRSKRMTAMKLAS